MQALTDHMDKESTDRRLKDWIMKRLTSWHDKDPLQPVTGNESLVATIQEQDRIGWENFLLRCISNRLIEYQQVHYNNLRSNKTGLVWATKLIRQL